MTSRPFISRDFVAALCGLELVRLCPYRHDLIILGSLSWPTVGVCPSPADGGGLGELVMLGVSAGAGVGAPRSR